MLGFAIAHKYAFSHTDFMETKAEQRAKADLEVSHNTKYYYCYLRSVWITQNF